MGVARLQSATVHQFDHVSITMSDTSEHDDAVGRGTDRHADGAGNIDPRVKAHRAEIRVCS